MSGISITKDIFMCKDSSHCVRMGRRLGGALVTRGVTVPRRANCVRRNTKMAHRGQTDLFHDPRCKERKSGVTASDPSGKLYPHLTHPRRLIRSPYPKFRPSTFNQSRRGRPIWQMYPTATRFASCTAATNIRSYPPRSSPHAPRAVTQHTYAIM